MSYSMLCNMLNIKRCDIRFVIRVSLYRGVNTVIYQDMSLRCNGGGISMNVRCNRGVLGVLGKVVCT